MKFLRVWGIFCISLLLTISQADAAGTFYLGLGTYRFSNVNIIQQKGKTIKDETTLSNFLGFWEFSYLIDVLPFMAVGLGYNLTLNFVSAYSNGEQVLENGKPVTRLDLLHGPEGLVYFYPFRKKITSEGNDSIQWTHFQSLEPYAGLVFQSLALSGTVQTNFMGLGLDLGSNYRFNKRIGASLGLRYSTYIGNLGSTASQMNFISRLCIYL